MCWEVGVARERLTGEKEDSSNTLNNKVFKLKNIYIYHLLLSTLSHFIQQEGKTLENWKYKRKIDRYLNQ